MESMERRFLQNLAMYDYIQGRTGKSTILNSYEPLSNAINPSAREVYVEEVERLEAAERSEQTRFIVLSSEMVGMRDVPHDITYNQPLSEDDVRLYKERPTSFLENMYARLGNAGVQPPNFYGHSPSIGDTFVLLTPEGTEGHFVDRFGFKKETEVEKLLTKEQQKAVNQGVTAREEFALLQSLNEYAESMGNESFVELVDTETKGRFDFLKDNYTISFNLAAVRELETKELDKLQILYNWEEFNGVENPLVEGVQDGHYFIDGDAIRNVLPETRRVGEGYAFSDYSISAGEQLQKEIDRRFERAAREISLDNSSFYRFEASPTPLGEHGEYDAFVQRYERANDKTYPRETVYYGDVREAAEVAQHLNAGSELGEFLSDNIRLRSVLNYDVLSGAVEKAAVAEENTQLEQNYNLWSGIVLDAMEAAGYTLDELESSDITDYRFDSHLVFRGEAGERMEFGNTSEAAEWLDGVVFDDPEKNRAVERVMHPDRFQQETERVAEQSVVAIESTDDYADTNFHADLADSDIQNEDGSYGRVVEKYRIVTVGENSRVIPYDNDVYLSRGEANQAAKEKGLVLTDYDSIIHEAMGLENDTNRTVINGVMCKMLDEFTDGGYTASIAREVVGEGFYYATVTAQPFGTHTTEYDHLPTREEVVSDYADWEAEKAIDRAEAAQDFPHREEEQPLVDIYNLEYDDEGYLHFTVAADGYELEGLYRLHDLENGEDMTIVSIDYADRHPIVVEQWNRIEQALYDTSLSRYNALIMEEREAAGEKEDNRWGNQENYRFFYSPDQMQEADAFLRETGWKRLFASDEQGMNGDTIVIYKDAGDLPLFLQEYARQVEQYQPMPNRYYDEALDLNGTAEELFTQAKNGYIESPEALAKVQEILSNPVENRAADAFYVGVLKEIAEDNGEQPYVFAQMKLDILDGMNPEEVTLREGLTLEVQLERDNVLIALQENNAEREATGATAISVERFVNMTAAEFSETVNAVYSYNMIEQERKDGREQEQSKEEKAIENLAERIDNYTYEHDYYGYADDVGIDAERRTAHRTEIANWIANNNEEALRSAISFLKENGENREATDLIYSLEHLEQYQEFFGRDREPNAETPVREFRNQQGRILEGERIPVEMSRRMNFADRSIIYRAVEDFENANNIPMNQREIQDGGYEDKEFLYKGYDRYVGMSHRNDLSIQPYMERLQEMSNQKVRENTPLDFSLLPLVAEVYYAQQNGLSAQQIDYMLDASREVRFMLDTVRSLRQGLEIGFSKEQLNLFIGEDAINQEHLSLFMQRGATIEQAAALKGSQVADYYILSDKMLNGTISTDIAKAIVQTVNDISVANEQDYMKQGETTAEPKARFSFLDFEFFTEYFAESVERDSAITADTIVQVGRSFVEQTETNNLKQYVAEHGGMANFNAHREEVTQQKENPVVSAEEQKDVREGVSLPEEKKDPKEKLNEQLQEGIKRILNTENFKSWLDTSSKMFYNNYSFSNAMLVWMQKPDATHTMGYEQWKEYGRNVAQGANSIKIFVPCIAYEKKDGDLWRMIKSNLDAQMRNNPSLGQAVYRVGMSKLEITMNPNHLYGLRVGGKERGIQSEKDIQNFIKHNIIGKVPMYFTVGNVFDVKDTVVPEFLWVKKGYSKDELVKGEDGKPIKNRRGEYKIYNTAERQARYNPHLDMSVPQKDPAKMAILYDALKAVSERNGIHVFEKDRADDSTLKGGADGYFSREFSSENPKGYIVMPTDLDPTKAVSVMLHEMTHSELHGNLERLAQRMGEDNIPSHMREIQAEAVAYVVGKNFGIETDMSSFQYLAAYTKGFELQALSKSIEVIYNECKQLTKELKSELEVRGLNMDLSERTNEPLTQEAVQTLSKAYATFAIEQSERLAEIEKELPVLAEQNEGHTMVMATLVEQGLSVERQKESVEAVRAAITAFGNADTLDAQKAALEAAEAAKGRVAGEAKKFDSLTEKIMEMKQNEHGLKDKFVADPVATLGAMKKDYPQLAKLSDSQIEYLAKSKFVSRELTPLLRNEPEKFVEAACQRASQLDKVASKNGFFVEVNFCEQWTDKPIFQGGAIMHPKVADSIIKQGELQVRALKMEAEKQGDYFPYCKCDVTVFRAMSGKIETAYNTRVDIGDGEQDSFVDHLKQMSSTQTYVADFEKATREKGAKEKILFNDTHGEEVKEVDTPLQDVPKGEKAMSREEWDIEIATIRNEMQEQGQDAPQQEQEQSKTKTTRNNLEK